VCDPRIILCGVSFRLSLSPHLYHDCVIKCSAGVPVASCGAHISPVSQQVSGYTPLPCTSTCSMHTQSTTRRHLDFSCVATARACRSRCKSGCKRVHMGACRNSAAAQGPLRHKARVVPTQGACALLTRGAPSSCGWERPVHRKHVVRRWGRR